MTRLFTGFDSAWGGRNRGAICNLRIGDDDHELELVDEPVTVSWDEACARLADYTTRDHVIAIDQPLVVPNASGLRPVDRKLAKALMRDYGLGAHAANTSNDACFGPQSGIWSFVESLEREGFEQTPSDVASRVPARRYLRVLPAPCADRSVRTQACAALQGPSRQSGSLARGTSPSSISGGSGTGCVQHRQLFPDRSSVHQGE